MSTFTVQIELTHIGAFAAAEPERDWRAVVATVDTGAAFSMLPAAFLAELGIAADGQFWFGFANAATDLRPVGHALFRVLGREAISRVIFGQPGEPVLLGAHTLESVLLGVDPVNEHLIPVDGLLY